MEVRVELTAGNNSLTTCDQKINENKSLAEGGVCLWIAMNQLSRECHRGKL